MKRLPHFLKRYFWDVDFERIDPQAYRLDILGRILEQGDQQAVTWMQKNFSEKDVKTVLSKLRTVSPKSANYWALVYGIDRKKVLCLQKHYLKIRKKHWPY